MGSIGQCWVVRRSKGLAGSMPLGLGLGLVAPLLPDEASGLFHARLLAHAVGLVLGVQIPRPDLVNVRVRVRLRVGVRVEAWA